MPKVTVNGISLSYADTGEGSPLLFLPGTGENKEYWHEYQVPFFAERGFRVVTVDQREIGESDRPGAQFETRDLASDAIGLLSAIGATEPAHVVGHSMGGRTAQWMALDYPDRVRSLTLVSSGSGQYDPSKPVERGLPVWQMVRMVEMGFEAYVRDSMSGRLAFTEPFRQAHPEILERIVEVFFAARPSVQAWLLHTLARQRHETTDRLPEIKAPTHVIVGKEDTVMGGTSFHPESSRVLASRIPNAKLSTPEGAHHIFWEHPQEVNELLLDFFRQVEPVAVGSTSRVG